MDGFYCLDCRDYFPKADADQMDHRENRFYGCPKCGSTDLLNVSLCACKQRETLPDQSRCFACQLPEPVDLDGLERQAIAFARRVFRQRGEPKQVTFDERALGQMLALAHQLGAASMLHIQRRGVARLTELSALLRPQAG
jgi:hypothetical protein